MSVESKHLQGDRSDWTFWTLMVLFNAACGVLVFEWAWFKTRRFRNPNKDLDALYPAYQRKDALSWKKWKLYPGAATLLLPRLIFLVIILVSLYVWLFILLLGHEKGEPITGCRKLFLQSIYKLHVHATSLLGFFNVLKWKQVSPENVGFYEEYLGSIDEQVFC